MDRMRDSYIGTDRGEIPEREENHYIGVDRGEIIQEEIDYDYQDANSSDDIEVD